MGELTVQLADKSDRGRFIHRLLQDIEALERMLREGLIPSGDRHIGAEQEFCILNSDWSPSGKALEILSALNDRRFTTELGLFNLELNLEPLPLEGSCISQMELVLNTLLHKASLTAESFDSHILLVGILPTILKRHLTSDFMTPKPRYHALNEAIRAIRGREFELHLTGVDELSLLHDSVLFEACNTSFQMHLQINPEDFVASYNWAQAIAGPLLAISANSPLLLGRELWSETRIALFQQSIDTRCTSSSLNEIEPRVTFGKDWIRGISDIYKDDIARYKILLSSDSNEDSVKVLNEGGIPELKALGLHNGTIYRWNRPCYGVTNGIPHLRIENRYMPSGPSVADEMANFALWIGMMNGRPPEYDHIEEFMDFRDAKINFINAARIGAAARMQWMNNFRSAGAIIREIFIPMAIGGLRKINVPESEIQHYMGIIEGRIAGLTGSRWMVTNFRQLMKKEKREDALAMLTNALHEFQKTNKPVNNWGNIGQIPLARSKHVSRYMTAHIFTAHEYDLVRMVQGVMEWKDIHHMPVENHRGEFIGLITSTNIDEAQLRLKTDPYLTAADIMVTDLITINEEETVDVAYGIMEKYGIGSLPVLQDNVLIGILTRSDLKDFRQKHINPGDGKIDR